MTAEPPFDAGREGHPEGSVLRRDRGDGRGVGNGDGNTGGHRRARAVTGRVDRPDLDVVGVPSVSPLVPSAERAVMVMVVEVAGCPSVRLCQVAPASVEYW